MINPNEPVGSLDIVSGESIIVVGDCEEPKAHFVEKVCQNGFSVTTALRALRYHENDVEAAINSLNNSKNPDLYLVKEKVDKNSKEFHRCLYEMRKQGVAIRQKNLAIDLLLDPDMFPAFSFELVSRDTHVATTSSAVASLDLPKGMKRVKVLADSGDVNAQFELGEYLKDRNRVIAAQYLKMAADQGHMVAQYEYVVLIGSCDGACDECEVSYYLKLSAEQGFEPAMLIYALRLELGKGLEPSLSEAVRYHTELAKRRGTAPLASLILCKDVETVLTIDAVSYLDEAIAQGDSIAKLAKAEILVDGSSKKEDILEAQSLLESCLETDLDPVLRTAAIGLYGVTLLQSTDRTDSEQYIRGMEYLKKSADAGVEIAAYLYGHMIVDTDLETGLEYLKKAADAGDPVAQREYANAIAHYRGFSRICCIYWKKSGEQGDPASLRLYGKCLYCGFGVDQDKKKAVKWFKMAAEAGDANAQFLYGRALLIGKYVNCDMREGLKYLEMAAKADIPEALLACGKWIAHRDKSEAVRYFHRAAEMGLVEAQLTYGRILLYDSNYRDFSEGVRYVKMAAESGLSAAKLVYGHCLFAAEETRQEGVMYLKMAADDGLAEAQAMYGEYLSTDKFGAEVDYEQALFYLRKAADQLSAPALNSMGKLYAEGLGVERNLFIAARCFRESAHLGCPAGQLNYALCLEQGHGVKRDTAAAQRLRQEAASKMSEESQKQWNVPCCRY